MNRSRPSRHLPARARGFTLLELMITVAVIGILAAIAYPAYGKYMVRSNRAAAQSYVMELAQAEAQYMADSRTYASLDDLKLTAPQAVSDKYTVTIALADGPPATFKISATPIAGTNQAGDGVLAIDNAGTRTPGDKW
jgi:type IV pilus assembly protein PilE